MKSERGLLLAIAISYKRQAAGYKLYMRKLIRHDPQSSVGISLMTILVYCKNVISEALQKANIISDYTFFVLCFLHCY